MGGSLVICQGWAASTGTAPVQTTITCTESTSHLRPYLRIYSIMPPANYTGQIARNRNIKIPPSWSTCQQEKVVFFSLLSERQPQQIQASCWLISQKLPTLNCQQFTPERHICKWPLYHYYVLQGGREPKGRMLLRSCDFGILSVSWTLCLLTCSYTRHLVSISVGIWMSQQKRSRNQTWG